MARPTNDRIIGVLLAGLFILGGLWVRCVWLQLLPPARHLDIARSQHETAYTIRAKRGTIYDRHARPLAVSVLAPSVFANARRISAKQAMAKRLARIVGRDARMIQRRLEKDKGFVWIARQVSREMVPDIRRLRREGVGILEEPKRVYPHGRLASHVVGFVNIDQRGLEQLELTLNGVLQGYDGWRATLHDARGHTLIGPWTTQSDPVDGYDVVLTIDSTVQQVAEEALEWGVETYRAQGGSITIMDPLTGAILAMANSPSYDANAPAEVSADSRRNRAVTDLFEPGSIFKIVTAAALLELGQVTPEETFFCEEGEWPTVGRHILHDHTPHGELTFHDVIRLSSNIGTSKAAQRLTPEQLYRYVLAFGFGRKTGIDLPGEVNGLFYPPSRWSKLSPYIIPIGHEISVTPIQLAVMTAIVANGGLRVRPYIVDRIQTANGEIIRAHNREEPARVLSPETAEILQTMLTSVVTSGTGRQANVQGLTVAGKTGTAQKIEPTGRYSHSRYVASFVGFGPVPDSRFVIVVNVDEPRGTHFGGTVAAPMFKRMVERLAGYWELERGPATRMAQM